MIASLPQSIQFALFEKLSPNLINFSSVSGGCINQGGKLVTSSGNFFIKWNDKKKHPGMFSAEAKGLSLLASTKTIKVPDVILNAEAELYQFLILEWIDSKPKKRSYWEEFGQQLASLHSISSSTFGLDHDNYIGSLPQSNQRTSSWVDFFIHQRIYPQLCLLNMQASELRRWDNFLSKLQGLLPSERPSLLHGDLWAGNVMVNIEGAPCLIDPAVNFGHREAEIAFTKLFGGFESRFYDSYQEAFPMAQNWPERLDIYNLYPLLVHANLFGGSYLRQAEGIIKSWV